MNSSIDTLRNLIATLKTAGFFTRLFQWKKIRTLLIDAAADLQRLVSNNELLLSDRQKLETALSLTNKDLQQATDIVAQSKSDIAASRERLNALQTELAITKEKYSRLLKDDEIRKQEHAKSLSTLSAIQQSVTEDRKKEVGEKQQLEIERLKNLKETWNRHEEYVSQSIKSISSRHAIEYVDKVPFTGNPDNTLLICDEFVVFDAKSPGSEDLKNFNSYLRDQAERAGKYAKQENVKTDIFFVIPPNALDIVKTFVYRMGDYNVYIISIDALEPVILSLKKIEDYKFVKDMSPEDRENICRIIGKFGHLAKRRIQVDSFFARQFIQLAYKCEADLPADILEKTIDFEKAEKLNPPVEKRAKAINLRELGNEIARIKEEATSKGIVINDDSISTHLNQLPLYKENDKNPVA